MRRLLAVCALMLAPLTAAQAPVYTVAGGIFCGAYRRAATQVQTWCWAGFDPETAPLVHNALTTLPSDGGSTIVTARWKNDTVSWHFTLKGTEILYQHTANGGNIRSGTL